MKTTKFAYTLILSLFIISCSNKVVFPVSQTVPAAHIISKKTKDKHNNYVVEIIAKNLAEANRLNPPKNNYSIWIVTNKGLTKNIGQLTNKNAKTTSFKATTPFDFKEIFITAEDQGNLLTPSGIEISRTSFKK